jgi:hypothetical protein
MPHLANAGKYALAHSVVFFGVFHPDLKTGGLTPYKAVWLTFMVLSTLYTFTWDITMDWGLGRPHAKMLRETTIYKRKCYYYLCMASTLLSPCLFCFVCLFVCVVVLLSSFFLSSLALFFKLALVDLVLRFAWTLTLVPKGTNSPIPDSFFVFLDPVLAASEVFRRSMWGILRLEYEHIITVQVPPHSLCSLSLPLSYLLLSYSTAISSFGWRPHSAPSRQQHARRKSSCCLEKRFYFVSCLLHTFFDTLTFSSDPFCSFCSMASRCRGFDLGSRCHRYWCCRSSYALAHFYLPFLLQHRSFTFF